MEAFGSLPGLPAAPTIDLSIVPGQLLMGLCMLGAFVSTAALVVIGLFLNHRIAQVDL